MACFLAPMSAAIIGSAVRKKIPARYHFNWLLSMLWGGVVMLIVEHISHKEVILYPPFFTAGLTEMLPEILRVGVSMIIGVVLVWGVMVLVYGLVYSKSQIAPSTTSKI